LKKGALLLIALLALLSLRLLLLPQWPLHDDEAVYAEILDEYSHNPLQLIPHYLGSPVSWKPPAAFYMYLAVAAPLGLLFPGIPPEFAYRAAPAMFALLSAAALFFLARRLFGEAEAFAATFIFATANATIVPTSYFLLDSALLFLILLALNAYLLAARDSRWLIAAAAFSILAALTKTYVALLIPLAAYAYFRTSGKRMDAPFYASLLAVPAAMLAYMLLFAALVPGGLSDSFSSYLYDIVGRVYTSTLTAIARNATTFFAYFFPWVLLAPAGFFLLRWGRAEDRALAWWSAISLLPLVSSSGYFWYYLPAVPPLSILAARALLRLRPLYAALLATAFAAISLSALLAFLSAPGAASGQVEAGLFLSGRGGVLAMTEAGVPTVLFYKFHYEAEPDYGSVTQMVAEPFAAESYTAFRSMLDLVFGTVGPSGLEQPDAAHLRSLITSSGKPNVLMSIRLYQIYSEDPLPQCGLEFVSSDLQLVALYCANQ